MPTALEFKMRIYLGALILVAASRAADAAAAGGAPDAPAPGALGRCRAHCRAVRPGALDDVAACLPAFKLPPAQKFYRACVDGRKRAFDRACVPLCAGGAMTVTSFEACRAVEKRGRKNVDWCRKVRVAARAGCRALRFAL